MADTFEDRVRKKLGASLETLIKANTSEFSLREIDAKTRKDHSWLGRIFRGEQNLTIDSLSALLKQFKIQPKDVFNFEVEIDETDNSEPSGE